MRGQDSKGNAEAPPASDPTRQRILGAAFGLFTKRGFARTSTLEIATRAKVSKRDLYAHFPTKQAMLAACIAERAKRMREPLQLPEPQGHAALAAVLTTFGGTILRVAADPAVLAVHRLAIAESDASPELARLLEDARTANRAALVTLLEGAQAQSLIAAAPASTIAEHYFALLWGDLLMRLLLRLCEAPKPEALEQRACAATAALLVLYPAP